MLISGLTVIVAMAGMFLSGDKTFVSFAEGTILVVAIAMFASLTVLPALLAWLGDRIEKGRIPFVAGGDRPASRGSGRRSSSRVMRRPWLSIVLAGGAAARAGDPGAEHEDGGLEHRRPAPGPRRDQDLQQARERAFPAEGVTADVVVKADDVRRGEAAAGISLLQRRGGVVQGRPEGDGDHLQRRWHRRQGRPSRPSGAAATPQSTRALEEIRNDIVPATLGGIPGVTVNVSGSAAQSKDFRDQLVDRLPLIFAFVFALAFVLMLVTFRSIVIPIKAILLNLLSIGAAYGVLVLIFQDGPVEDAARLPSNGGVTSWLPLFLFVILFGLSMDYHVFILSRVREGYESGMSTPEAVRHGISATAGTVTSAAVVMVVVFSVFVTLRFLDFKEMGVGLAVAVLIDATIVRGVLLPASMKILGDWNWYLPKWLEWIPKVSHEPAPEPPQGAPTVEPVKV